MNTTIDSAGRIVASEAAQQALSLEPGQFPETEFSTGRPEIEVPPSRMRLETVDKGFIATDHADLPVLTVEQVRYELEHLRR